MNLPVPAEIDRIKYLNPEELSRLTQLIRDELTAVQKEFHEGLRYRKALVKRFRNYLLVLFLLETGARIGEAVLVERRHLKIHQKEPYIILPTLKRRKTLYRQVPVFSDELISMLTNFVLYREAVEGRKILGTDRVFGLSKRQAQDVVRRILLQVVDDTSKAHAHTLRHTFGILWTMRRLSPFTLASWMGHATLNTTMAYTQIAIRDNYEYARRLYEEMPLP